MPGQACHRFQTKAAADSTATLPPIPGEGCHPYREDSLRATLGTPSRYPALFSHREGGADACTEVSHASSPRGGAASMGAGAQ